MGGVYCFTALCLYTPPRVRCSASRARVVLHSTYAFLRLGTQSRLQVAQSVAFSLSRHASATRNLLAHATYHHHDLLRHKAANKI